MGCGFRTSLLLCILSDSGKGAGVGCEYQCTASHASIEESLNYDASGSIDSRAPCDGLTPIRRRDKWWYAVMMLRLEFQYSDSVWCAHSPSLLAALCQSLCASVIRPLHGVLHQMGGLRRELKFFEILF